MTLERPDAILLAGKTMTLLGPALEVGQPAPDFEAVGVDLNPIRLADTQGSVRIFSVVPSVDTPVCDTQTRRFNEEAAGLSGVQIYTISMDLPFALKRWCAAAGVDRVTMLSDHRNGSFGKAYGTLVKDWRIESRALFVLDSDGVLQHVEYVRDTATQPDYDAALNVIRGLA